MSESKVPEIRFEGFSGEWEEKEFKSITKINQGLQISISSRYTEKIDNSFFYITNEFLKENSTVKYYIVNPLETVLCTKNDVLMTRTGNTGEVVTNIEGAFHNNFFKIQFDRKKLNKNYLVYFLKLPKTQALILRLAGVSTIPDLNHTDFYKIKISYSKLEEQTKIGNYFQNLDKLIEQKEKKQQKLKQLKKAMLDKMFPKDGADRPEIRFEGFSGVWEEKKLELLADFSKGQGYSKNDLTKNGTPIILYGRLYTKYQTVISEVDTFVVGKNSSIYSKGHEVIVPASGETAEDIARASAVKVSGTILGGDLNIIYPKDIINNVFLALTISNGKTQKDLSKKAQGKSVVHVRNADLKEIDLSYPKLEEQTKIGNYFQKLDKLIDLHQRELEKLKNIKKASLAKMFV